MNSSKIPITFDWFMVEKLAKQGFLFTCHTVELFAKAGHGKDVMGLSLEEIKKLWSETYPVVGLKGGVEVEKGKFSIIIDADGQGVFEWLEENYPETFGKTLTWFGSKRGHFVFTTDKEVPSSSINVNKENTDRILDVLSVGRTAVMPPSQHRKVNKRYEVLRDANPLFVPWDTLQGSLFHLCSIKNYYWPAIMEVKPTSFVVDADTEEIKKRRTLLDIDSRLRRGIQSCPLFGHKHNDRSPSLYVSDDGSWFNCFAVHGGGDIFTWLKQNDGLEFPEAKKKLATELGLSLEDEFRIFVVRINDRYTVKIYPLEKTYRVVFQADGMKKSFEFKNENFYSDVRKLREIAKVLEPDLKNNDLRAFTSLLIASLSNFRESDRWQQLIDTKKEIESSTESNIEIEEIAFGYIEGKWVESIQKDGKLMLLVCKQNDFLDYEIVESYETENKVYYPTQPPENMDYILPPEPLPYDDETTLDDMIKNLALTALDLKKGEKIYGNVWDAIILPFIKFTWNYDDFNTSPFLKFVAEYGSGKSACLNFVGSLCYRPAIVGGQTLAVVLRLSDMHRPTLVWNELEIDQSTDNDLAKLINNKFQRDYVFLRADSNDQKKIIEYRVYGPIIAASRKSYADASTESRFVTVPVDETYNPNIDLFFEIRKKPEYQTIIRMLFYRRLKNKQKKITASQELVKSLPISKRSQQKYALLLPHIEENKRDVVIRTLLIHEVSESKRRAESEEGIIFNEVLNIISEDNYEENNIEYGVATKELMEKSGLKRIKRVMESLGFYEKLKHERIVNNGQERKLRRRKWYIKDKDFWLIDIRRYLPFTFKNLYGKFDIKQIERVYDVDLEDFSPTKIPYFLTEKIEYKKLPDDIQSHTESDEVAGTNGTENE